MRRPTIATAVAAQANADYTAAIGRADGDPWTQPAGAHDAYRTGATVAHGGKVWTSLTPNNVWEPGVSGWREVVTGGSAPAAWVQPTGAHDAYAKGTRVTFGGKAYESLINANTWSPTASPAGWKLIT